MTADLVDVGTTSGEELDRWRGVKAETGDDLPADVSIRLRRRSRALIRDLLRPHRRATLITALAIMVGTAAQMAIPALVGAGIDHGVNGLRQGDATPIVVISVSIAACAALQAWLTRVFLRGSGRIGQDLLLELRRRVFRHFQTLSLAFHESYTSGRVISRLTSDMDSITTMLEAGFESVVTSVLSIVSVSVILLVLDWPLALASLVSFVPLALLSQWYQRRSTVAYRRTREEVAVLIVQFTESLRGIRAVQAFRREPRNSEIFAALNERYRVAMTTSFRLLGIFWPGILLIGNVTTALVLLYGGYRVVGGEMQVGVLASFVLYLRQFFEPMAEVSQFYDAFQGAAAGLEKLSGVLEERPGVPMPAVSPALSERWRGAVEFDAVEFGYRPDRKVLPGLSLEIPAGQTVALLGETGAGKSTVARLLARFYDPVRGAVRIDGIDLRSLAEPDLRAAVAMVTQESFLFTGTVADNIAFGRPDADREEIEAAGAAVGVDRIVQALPGGWDATVGKNGASLSAGQRQLIALARALLADPAVLILDEASSSLDAPTERLVQRALRTVLAGRTAVVIAHRLSTVGIADRVLVMSQGRIVEDGAPADLLDTGGSYAALVEAWRESLI
jgi:ABC-type multidrug transport system fused ATPase/permease subunit